MRMEHGDWDVTKGCLQTDKRGLNEEVEGSSIVMFSDWNTVSMDQLSK